MEIVMNTADLAVDTETTLVGKSESHDWCLEAYALRGTLWLRYKTTAPFRAQQGRIVVYNGGSFPQNPLNDVKVSRWDSNPPAPSPWNTGLDPSGGGWYCAWIAEKINTAPNDDNYTYVVQLVTAPPPK
jgi:hypothetical protein